MSRRVALVTGAGGGIGAATALALARGGADVCIIDVKADGLAATAKSIEALGRQCQAIEADLSKAENCHKAVAQGRSDAGTKEIQKINAPVLKRLINASTELEILLLLENQLELVRSEYGVFNAPWLYMKGIKGPVEVFYGQSRSSLQVPTFRNLFR